MTSQYVVIIDDLSSTGPVEEAIVRLTAQHEANIHVVSAGDGRTLVTTDGTPRHIRLMFLIAKLADRLITVSGELAARTDVSGLQQVVDRLRADRVYVATQATWTQRLLGRDLASRLRALVDVEVVPLALAAS